MKHVLVQAIYQLIVMIVVIFWGHLFLPEEFDTAAHGSLDGKKIFGFTLVRSGIRGAQTNGKDNYDPNAHEASRHFTYGFNIFVCMQIFNFINARKIDDSFNTFEGITKSKLFIIIVFIIIVLQVVIVTFGWMAFKVTIFVSLAG